MMKKNREKKNPEAFILVGILLAVFTLVVLLPQDFWVHLSMKFFP